MTGGPVGSRLLVSRWSMCKCNDLDIKIKRYREIAAQVLDEKTSDGIAHLIADFEAQKKGVTS